MYKQNDNESNDLPWWTEEEEEHAIERLHCLKANSGSYDSETNQYRDIRWMYFRPQVLEKYRNNELCDIGNEYISFLRHVYNKKTRASTVNFIRRNLPNINVLMLQTQDHVYVPPRERRQWQDYQIPEREIQFI
jgi:hypothetical protein